ncbi:MAG TPA: GNAT family N-acetyltransferase [Rhodoferax sp.]|nr:GNAT family N-acetyltransferase [Rhodoferax sp.]HPW30689.1 GNAT family N-acetyltransferase [Rhodoferax sp.]
MKQSASAAWALAPVVASDFEALLALRLRAMRESLTQLGRYDEERARARLAEGFVPANTHHIEVQGQRVGFLVLKRLSQALRLDHFYIDLPWQNRGIGAQVMRWVCEQADAELLPIELCALKDSASNRFYLRWGFAKVGEGEWDNDYLRMPATPSVRAVRQFWAALQARDWAAARVCLFDDMETVWWTSGERFTSADALIEVNQHYPEGWTIHLLEVEHLQDGRVMSLTRVDHPPQRFFATSFFRVDNGRIAGIDEYWATVEFPPDWRTPQAFAGLSHFDPSEDPRAHIP